MAITITHSTPADASFSATGAAAWDATHSFSGVLPIAYGGTNAADAATALTNLGAYPASNPNGYTSNTGTVTGVTGTAPVVSSGGTAPVISMAKATTLVDGYLSATDWNTFNNKQPAGSYLTAVTADAPLSGSGTSGSHLVIATANTTTTGAISSTDWNTFNGKQAALVSGTNIKTVNGTSLLGSGDVSVGVTQIIAGTNVTISPVGGTGAVTINASGGGGGTPGGSNTQVQYNNSGAFGGSSAFTWDGTTLKATNLETTGGVIADGNFGGTFVDGVVIDYDPVGGNGRFSVGTGDKFTFYNGGVAGTVLGSIATNGDWSITRFLDVGNGTLIGGSTNSIIAAAGSANQYVQAYIHNDLAGSSASADLAAYPDNGTDASGWIDMGITSSTYSDASYLLTGANEGYIFMSAPSGSSTSGNLVYATDSTGSSNAHQWYVGGFNVAKSAWKMQLNSTNLTLGLPLNSTVATGTAPFTVASTTQVANLNAATAGTATTATNATNIANTGAVSTNASFFPTFLANNTTSNQGTNTAAGLSFNPSTNILSPTAVLLAAGTTARAPLQLTSGTNLTTAQAGAMEYDGAVPYFSMAASTRGVLHNEQVVILGTAYTLTSQTAAQKLFNATTNGAVTLPIGTYQFECFYSLSSMSATSGSFGFALVAGTAVVASQGWVSIAEKGGGTVATAIATQSTYSTAANTALTTVSSQTVGYAYIKGFVRITTAGTLIPSVSLGVAAAAIVGVNSYFKISPISGTGTAATNFAVGNWS